MLSELFTVMFSKKAFVSYTRTFGIALMIMGASSVYMLNNMVTSIAIEHRKVIDKIVVTDGVDLSIICSAIGAKRIHYQGKMFGMSKRFILVQVNKDVTIRGLTYQVTPWVLLTRKLCEIIDYENKELGVHIKVFTPVGSYLNGTIRIAVWSLVLFWLLSLTLHIKYSIGEYRSNNIEAKALLLEAETRLQRTITEFAHHEMTLPIAVIKTLFDDMFREWYGCDSSISGVCTFDNKTFQACQNCTIYTGSAVDEQAKLTYNEIHLAIEGLETVLNQMSETKSIKYGNGNISIAKLLRSSVQGVNIDVNKISYEIIDEEILEKYAVAKPANNGLVLNIISNHVTNSKEALAATVTFRHKLVGGSMQIYIIDDGSGIRDAKGEIMSTDSLFVAGMTTKDENGKNVFIQDNKLVVLLKRMFGTYAKVGSTRGVGLFLNKELMKKHGGDVELIETSQNGTTFRLTFPCKQREM